MLKPMTNQLQSAIAAVQSLSTNEQLELLNILSGFLQQSHTLEAQNQAFWTATSLDDLIRNQQPKIIHNLSMLASDVWEDEATSDDFLTFLYEQRQVGSTKLE